jgi:hypothetical protein
MICFLLAVYEALILILAVYKALILRLAVYEFWESMTREDGY